PIADICEGEFLAELPTTSTNGITGTWLPALDNTQTTTYTFTADLGQCATTASVTIVVNDAPDSPTADSPQMLTEGQTVADIVVTGVTGTLNWYSDEDLTNNVEESMMLVEGAYTFWVTQTVGNCTSSATEITVEVSLSRNVFDQASFRVYPNPVREILNISYSKDITDVTVINMLGQVVISQTASSADTQVDMSVLPTGSYLVKVTVDGIAKTIKVIKQ
ncbi:MAG: T9SS type A sorting domain-containing protein, partial [Flavobacteriaceae bacterium]